MAINLTPTELAYIAGLFDGEGTISLIGNQGHRTKPAPNGYVSARVEISNTNRVLIDWLQVRLGGQVHTTGKYSPTCKQGYKWRAAMTQPALDILEAVLPYLVIKRAQAEIVLEYGKRRQIMTSKLEHYTDLVATVRALNKKGPALGAN